MEYVTRSIKAAYRNDWAARPSRLTVLDLCCGAGGLSCGFGHDDRFDLVAAVEIEEDSARTYRSNHPGARVYRKDIREFDAGDIRRDLGISSVDVVVSGLPCQAYSTIRKRRRHDPRGRLFARFYRILCECKPTLFVAENVRGLLSIDGGRLFERICALYRSSGYRVGHRLLDAADYGVPQFRQRLFLVGTRLDRPFVFPRPTHGFGLRPHLTVGDAISDLPLIEAGESSNEYASAPQNEYQARMRGNADRLVDHVAPHHADRLVTLMRMLVEGGAARELESSPDWFKSIRSYRNTYCKLRWDRPCTTITRNFSTPSSSRCIHPKVPRALTIREAARLQGFPDDYKFCGPKVSRHVQIGDAVPPPVSSALAVAIAEHCLRRDTPHPRD